MASASNGTPAKAALTQADPSPAAVAIPALSRGVTLVLAGACALTVANIYYNQPLIGLLTRAFGNDPAVGFVPTATQIGYAIGIVTLIPLGDRVDRCSLIVVQTLVLSVALALVALAPTTPILLLASLLVGVSSTIPQQIIPFAADLAAPEKRGAVIGAVMSGLLIGILLARTVSGFIGEALGWRAVYVLAVAVTLGTAAALAAVLPSRAPTTRLSYGRLLASAFVLIREEPRLRAAAAIQTCLFASFGMFWTVLALRLEQPPYRLGADAAGLFGIVGVAGALAAPVAGRIADRFGPRTGILVGIVAMLAAWVVLGTLPSLAAMVVGVLMLDAGVQGAMIGHQTVIFALRPEARNRVNMVYMGALFSGGALGSAAAILVWREAGWAALCLLAGGVVALALVLHLATKPRAAPGSAA